MNTPLVSLREVGVTRYPTPGRYYQMADRRLMLCIDKRDSGGSSYWWFVDAEAAPVTVLDGPALDVAPVMEMKLLPLTKQTLHI